LELIGSTAIEDRL